VAVTAFQVEIVALITDVTADLKTTRTAIATDSTLK
jgi:hypothetical protein